MPVDTLTTRTYEALLGIWPGVVAGLINGLLTLIVALIVLIIGWIIALGIGQSISKIFSLIQLNKYFEKTGLQEALKKADIKVDAESFIGGIVKWVLFLVVLMMVAEVLGLVQFASLLQKVLGYLPNVLVAVFLFVAAVIVSEILEKVVRTAIEGTKVGHGALAGAIVKWSIWAFAILAILKQLLIVPSLVTTVFNAIEI